MNRMTLIKRCIGQAEQATNLEAGVYQLQLPFLSSLHSKYWALKTTPRFSQTSDELHYHGNADKAQT